jgi:hypothetical protein
VPSPTPLSKNGRAVCRTIRPKSVLISGRAGPSSRERCASQASFLSTLYPSIYNPSSLFLKRCPAVYVTTLLITTYVQYVYSLELGVTVACRSLGKISRQLRTEIRHAHISVTSDSDFSSGKDIRFHAQIVLALFDPSASGKETRYKALHTLPHP